MVRGITAAPTVRALRGSPPPACRCAVCRFAPLHYVPEVAAGIPVGGGNKLTLAYFHNPDYRTVIPHPTLPVITVGEHWWMLFNRNDSEVLAAAEGTEPPSAKL